MLREERSRNPFSASFIDEEGPFGDKTVRKHFVAKVCLIVAIMLLPVFSMSLLPFANEDISEWLYDNNWKLIIVGFVIYFVALCVRCVSARQNPACGYVLLVMLVVSQVLIVPCICNLYDIRTVLYALPITIITVFLVAVLARYGSCDVTGCRMLLLVLTIALLVYGVVTAIMMFVHPYPILYLLFVFFICFLSVIYMWFHLQLIMGGRRYELSVDNYVLAAAVLFIDIVILFVSLVQLIGSLIRD